MTQSTLEGADEINRKLHLLTVHDEKLGKRVMTPVFRAGGTAIAKQVRRRAPGKSLRRSVGSKLRRRKGQLSVKAGLNVGKKGGKRLHQAHLLTIGTKRRQTRSGANRGRVKEDDFVAVAAKEAQGKAVEKMQTKLNQRLDIELPKRIF